MPPAPKPKNYRSSAGQTLAGAKGKKQHPPKPAARPSSKPSTSRKTLPSAVAAPLPSDDSEEGEQEEGEGEEGDEEEQKKEPLKKRGKKGKKFVESQVCLCCLRERGRVRGTALMLGCSATCQDALLSLVASITNEKEVQKKDKLAKVVRPLDLTYRNLPAHPFTSQKRPKAPTAEAKEKSERETKKRKQLVHRPLHAISVLPLADLFCLFQDAAKAVVAAQARAKKDRIKDEEALVEAIAAAKGAPAAPDAKKRVSFA
jgi:hypothetical protein